MSRKVLVGFVTCVFLFLIFGMLQLRKDIIAVNKGKKIVVYKDVEIGAFTKIHVASNWVVLVKPGKDCCLQIEEGGNSMSYRIEGGELFLPTITDSNKVVHAKIKLPKLQLLTAVGNGTIKLSTYKNDVLKVDLKDESSFISEDNQWLEVDISTSGKPKIKFITTDL